MNKIKKFENFSNTVSDPNPSERSQDSIFVSIVSYRDPDVLSTLVSLIKNAKRPENIYISIVASVIQNHEDWVPSIVPIAEQFGANLNVKQVECREYHKIGELKSLADSVYNKEKYYMSVHSCTEFDPHWDDILIKQYDSISSISSKSNIVFTADPRSFIPTDEVIDGYNFFTNHKTRVSFQREGYDGSRVPISGFPPSISMDNFHEKDGSDNSEDSTSKYVDNIGFFKEYGFPKFSNRTFYEDEVFAPALGFSSKFIFSYAKEYLKNISVTKIAVAEEDFNFIALFNLIENDFSLITPRWLPLYHLYERKGMFPITRKSPLDFYEDKEELKNSESHEYIQKLIKKLDGEEDFSKRDYFNKTLCLDFKNKEFKLRKFFVVDGACMFANLAVSAYNFSTKENTLHWNKRDV